MQKPKSHGLEKDKPYDYISLQSREGIQVKGINLDKKNSSSKAFGNTQWSGGIKYIDKRKGSMLFSLDGSRKFKITQMKLSSFKVKKQKDSGSIPITMRDIEPNL